MRITKGLVWLVGIFLVWWIVKTFFPVASFWMKTRPSTRGKETKPLTGLYYDSRPSVSPDGQRLLFSAWRHGTSDIYVAPRQGGKPTPLTNNGQFNTDPVFSPNGSKIAFVSSKDRWTPQVYLMDADGTHVQRLTYSNLPEFHPSFSPDGSQLVFARSARPMAAPGMPLVEALGGQWDVYVITSDGSSERRVTNQSYRLVTSCSFAPDGETLLVAGTIEEVIDPQYNQLGFKPRMLKVDVGGTRPPIPVTNEEGDYASYSRDGKKIVYLKSILKDNQMYNALMVMSAEGLMPMELLRRPEDLTDPVFAPDGKTILFLAAPPDGDANTLWEVDIAGAHLHPVKLPL
ncbi:MAG: PD40 domain-containing protein [Elusimicrobia bacterium]|nr:PD40 domain-containing protein [Elusimicrobiota bacterium]